MCNFVTQTYDLMFMKKFLFILLVLVTQVNAGIAQTEKAVAFTYSEESFDFYKHANGTTEIVPSGANNFVYHEDLTEPALPYEMQFISIKENEELIDFKCSFTEKLVCEDVVIMQNPIVEPTVGGGGYSGTTPEYEDKVYPDKNITYVNKMLIDGQYCLCFEVCPFHYDAAEKKLYLLTDIKLNIKLKSESVPVKPFPYDLDGDGTLTLNDITTLINIYLEKSE